MSGRASLASSRMSAAVSSTSSNTADQRTLASWLAPTAVSFDSGEQRAAIGVALRVDSVGDAHVEAGVGEARAGDGHQLPRLLLAEDGVAAPVGAGAQQCGQHALEPGDVVLEVGALRAVVDDGALDRLEHLAGPLPLRRGLATNTSRSHTPVRSGGSRRTIERRVLARDRARPLLERDDELAGDAGRRVERAAVETGEEGLGDVVAGAHDGRRRGHLDAARAVAADGVDHAGERGAGDGAGVDARVERGDAAGHGVDDVGEAVGVDERGRPAHRVRRVVAA